MPILGIIVPPISDVTFLMNFGSRQGLPGGINRAGGGGVPTGVFFNILDHDSDIIIVF